MMSGKLNLCFKIEIQESLNDGVDFLDRRGFTNITILASSDSEHVGYIKLAVLFVALHLKGVSQRDISDSLDCSRTTVQRKLKKYL